MEITGLDLDATGVYDIVIDFKNAFGSATTFRVYFNNDTTAANYYNSYHFSASSGNSATANFATLNNGESVTGVGTLVEDGDGEKVLNGLWTYRSATTWYSANYSHMWNSTSNLTSIKISATNTDAIAIGGYIKVYRRVGGPQGTTGAQGTTGIQGIEGLPGTQKGCVVTRELTTQAFSTSTSSVVFDTELFDEENYWSAGDPSVITIPVAGWYTVVGTVQQSTDADDVQVLYISKNGSGLVSGIHATRLTAGAATIAMYSQVIDFDYYDAGDELELKVTNRTSSSSAYARLSILRSAGVGSTGAQGATGTQGANGVQGTTGTQGLDGLYAAQGAQGTTGIQGADGVQGTTGAGTQGTTGSQGADGPQGTTGTQGITGSQGTTGAGTQGADGVQGTTGTQGADGPQGTTGAGTQGTTGSQGADGPQGIQGIQGLDGLYAAQGIQGTTGIQGTAGSGGGGDGYPPQLGYIGGF
jgi:hypothetical protein